MRLLFYVLLIFMISSSAYLDEIPKQHQAKWYSKVNFVYRSQNLCFLSERDDEWFRVIRPEFEACSLNIDAEFAVDFEDYQRYSVAVVDQLPDKDLPKDLFMISRLKLASMDQIHLRYEIYDFLVSRLIPNSYKYKEDLSRWFALALIYKDCRSFILEEDERQVQRVLFNNFGADFIRDDLDRGTLSSLKDVLSLKFNQDSNWLNFRNSEYAFYAFRALKSSKLFKNFSGIKEAFFFQFDTEPLKKKLEKKTEKSLDKWFNQFLDMRLYSKHYPFPPQKIQTYLSNLTSFELLLPNEDGEIALQNVNYDQLEEYEEYLKGKKDLLQVFQRRLQVLKLRSPVLFNEVFELYDEALEQLEDEDYDDFADYIEEAQELELEKLNFYKNIYKQMRSAEMEQRFKIFKKALDSTVNHLRKTYPTVLKDYLDYLDSVKKWYN